MNLKWLYLNQKAKNYEAMQFHVKKNDNKYKIHSISGQTEMNLNSCLIKKEKSFR